MSDYIGITEELAACFAARTPLVILETEERDRAQSALSDVARSANLEIDFYTDCNQFVELRRGERKTDVGREPLAFIEETLKKKSGCIFALGDVRFLDGDNAFSRHAMGLVRLAALKKSTIVIVTADPVWMGLGKLGMYLKLSLPTQAEREKQLKSFIDRNKIKTVDRALIPHVATMLSGYTAMQLSTIMNFVYKSAGGFTYDELCKISARKDKLFGKIPSITRIPVGHAHVAGLDGVKTWLDRKRKIFFAPKAELDKKNISPPKGILLAGVPGCGKSLSARLIAEQWGLPLYRFDIGALFDKYVGESEKNLRLALEYVNSVSPCVLWIDEIEKELASNGDNDTAKRILGSFLYWLQEFSGRIFLVATANDISLMPPELFRKGRLSEIFFVDLPTPTERKSAIELYAGLCLSLKLSEAQKTKLAEMSDGFSYADIEAAVKSVAESEYINGKTESFETLERAFADTVGIMAAQPELIVRSRKWGDERAVPASGSKR